MGLSGFIVVSNFAVLFKHIIQFYLYMKKIILLSAFVLLMLSIYAQDTIHSENKYQNTAERLLATEGKLLIGGYGEVHYNQPLRSATRNSGSLDVHRIVMFLGYNFNKRTQFITELEFEHVNQVAVEQAFIQYKMNQFLNLKAGLFLIPMGIINENHEPVTFFGVERPLIDKTIMPSTWSEIGAGFNGNILGASLKYQAYIVNGVNSFDNQGELDGKNGLRNGRQEGGEMFVSSPDYTGKVEYYGIRGLNIGLSGFFGKTESSKFNGIDRHDQSALAAADSSVVGISMVGLDARYGKNGLQLRGQLYYVGISNSYQYNVLTARNNQLNDLGKSMLGYYVEAGYNVLHFSKNTENELIPFIRLESYNTHHTVAANISKNKAYDVNVITTGINYKLAKGVVIKADVQFSKPQSDHVYSKTFNAGFGLMF